MLFPAGTGWWTGRHTRSRARAGLPAERGDAATMKAVRFFHDVSRYGGGPVSMLRGGPQVQAFLRERRFHLVASASTLFRRLAASIAAGS